MTFKEALAKLREIADGRYCTLEFALTEFSKESEHPPQTECRAYVDLGMNRPGVSGRAGTFEAALVELMELIQKEEAARLLQATPDLSDEPEVDFDG